MSSKWGIDVIGYHFLAHIHFTTIAYHIRLILFVQSGSIPQEGHFKFGRPAPDGQYRSPEESVFLNQTRANGIEDIFFLKITISLKMDKEPMNGCDAGKANEMSLALLFGGHGRLGQKKNLCLEISSNMSIEQGTTYFSWRRSCKCVCILSRELRR